MVLAYPRTVEEFDIEEIVYNIAKCFRQIERLVYWLRNAIKFVSIFFNYFSILKISPGRLGP